MLKPADMYQYRPAREPPPIALQPQWLSSSIVSKLVTLRFVVVTAINSTGWQANSGQQAPVERQAGVVKVKALPYHGQCIASSYRYGPPFVYSDVYTAEL